MTHYGDRNFEVVFVTAHREYAMEALKAGALGYLMKPVSISELQQTVVAVLERIKAKHKRLLDRSKPAELSHKTYSSVNGDKLFIKHTGGYKIVNIMDIVRLEAQSNYTRLYFRDLPPVFLAKTLKKFYDILDPTVFFRIHKSHLININFIEEYDGRFGGKVTLVDGTEFKVGNLRRASLREFLLSKKHVRIIEKG